MPRNCIVCEHPDRASIELALSNRVTVAVIMRRHKLTKDTLYRHRKSHMPPQLVAQMLTRGRLTEVDLEGLRIAESEGLLTNLIAQRARLYRMADMAEDTGDIPTAAAVHGRLTMVLELTAKLLGDLQAGSQHITQNILVLPEYHALRTELVRALKPYPDARLAVVHALRSFESPALITSVIEHE